MTNDFGTVGSTGREETEHGVGVGVWASWLTGFPVSRSTVLFDMEGEFPLN